MTTSIKKQAESIFIKNEYKPISELEIADYIGFTDKEKDMLKLFWNSAFNESLIYLSDELFLNHLTDEIKKQCSSFYKQNSNS